MLELYVMFFPRQSEEQHFDNTYIWWTWANTHINIFLCLSSRTHSVKVTGLQPLAHHLLKWMCNIQYRTCCAFFFHKLALKHLDLVLKSFWISFYKRADEDHFQYWKKKTLFWLLSQNFDLLTQNFKLFSQFPVSKSN